MKVTAIILAGGKNLRLGRVKATEIIGGKIIVERVIERLRPLAGRILIVTGSERNDLLLPLKDDTEFLTDLYPGYGPLGGIYTGLVASRTSHSIAVACDMPFLNTELLAYMIEQAADFDAVVPRLDGGTIEPLPAVDSRNRLNGGIIEPLHAVYSISCLEKIKERLERKQLSVESFVKASRVRYIEQAESQRLDPGLLSFFNINYQADLEKAIAIEAENRG